MLRNSLKRRFIGIYISGVALLIMASVIAFIMYRYHVEGEEKMPFEITEFLVISTAQTSETVLNEENYQSNIIQKNDIYISLEKNAEYKDDEIIKKVSFNNFKVTKTSDKGILNIYRPSKSEKAYEYTNEYIVTNGFEYLGDKFTDTKGEILTIGNQGGIINFSIAITDLGVLTYSKEEKLVADGTLLNRIAIGIEDIKAQINFDMVIELESGKKFKSNIKVDVPAGDILNNGISKENIDEKKLVFKR